MCIQYPEQGLGGVGVGESTLTTSLTFLLYLKLPFVLQPFEDGFGVQPMFTIEILSLVGRLINASNQRPQTEVV